MTSFSLGELTSSQRLTVLGWLGTAWLLTVVFIAAISSMMPDSDDTDAILVLTMTLTSLATILYATTRRGYELVKGSPLAGLSIEQSRGVWCRIGGGFGLCIFFMMIFPVIGEGDATAIVLVITLSAVIALYSTLVGVRYGGQLARQDAT